MKVIVYINEPREMQNAHACLEWALSEPDLKQAGAMHLDEKVSFFHKRDSGTVVIHVQPKKESA